LDLPWIRSSADDEVIGDDGLLANIQDDNIRGLLVHGDIRDGPRNLS
jgi:hypothetical protein